MTNVLSPLVPSTDLDRDSLTARDLGLTGDTLRDITEVMTWIIYASLRACGHEALAYEWLSLDTDDRYAFARVWSGEIMHERIEPSTIAHHRIGLDALVRFTDAAHDTRVHEAFEPYTLLAYQGEHDGDEDALIEELRYVGGHWSSVLDLLEEHDLCVYSMPLKIQVLESLYAIEAITGCTHCYQINCALCESQPCRCDRCVELRPNHDENCWCRICAPKHYARLAIEAADEPRVTERRRHPRQRSRRDFADAKELPGFLRDDQCPHCGRHVSGCHCYS